MGIVMLHELSADSFTHISVKMMDFVRHGQQKSPWFLKKNLVFQHVEKVIQIEVDAILIQFQID
jgi:hypothetical protein